MQKMDKYEFNIKKDQIRKLVNKGDYQTAMKIVSTIDWERVKNGGILSMVSQVYEKNGEYEKARDILVMALERVAVGKRLLYKLVELSLKVNEVEEAQNYYDEFVEISSDDPRQYILRYLILKKKQAPIEQQIHSLEIYNMEELDEKWMYELAELHQQAGNVNACIEMCDRLMLMFGLGNYVEKAMELKVQYAPLTEYQQDLAENRDKYEARLQAIKEHGYIEETEEKQPNEVQVKKEQPVIVEPENSVEQISNTDIEETALEREEPVPINSISSTDFEEEVPVIEETFEEEVLIEEDFVDELPAIKNHIMIESRTPEKGMEKAILTLKQIREETGIKNQVVKTNAAKLNKIGILENKEKLQAKDIMIEYAGELSEGQLVELKEFLQEDKTGVRVVLIDNPKQLELIHKNSTELATMFECIGTTQELYETVESKDNKEEKQEDTRPVRRVVPVKDTAFRAPDGDELDESDKDVVLSIDDFAQYACQYANSIDCSVTGKSMLALYERIEIMKEDGVTLTKEHAEDLIEEVADRAEHPPVSKIFSNMFVSKYDKEGLLVLKEEHFV